MYILFYVGEVIGFVDWLDRKVYKYEKSLEMCICIWPEFDCPEVTLCGWQDIKIQLLLLLLFFIVFILQPLFEHNQESEEEWSWVWFIWLDSSLIQKN